MSKGIRYSYTDKLEDIDATLLVTGYEEAEVCKLRQCAVGANVGVGILGDLNYWYSRYNSGEVSQTGSQSKGYDSSSHSPIMV